MAHVLLVEDDQHVMDMLTQVLQRDGHTVTTAVDGEDALQALQKIKPDIIVTDIIMPKKSGTALIKEVKANHPEMKIIAISGGGRSDPIGYLDLSEELGADISFAKPVEPKALLMTISLLTMQGEEQGKVNQ
jgi:DNA-binding response OmpR family regulator